MIPYRTRLLQWILIIIAIAAYAWNEVQERHEHYAFFHDMREFKEFSQRGERFTYQDGINLCEAINSKHRLMHLPPMNCEEILSEEGYQK